MNLKGKTAFITGGSRGIGSAICKELASKGANIAFTFNSDEKSAIKVKSGLEENGTRVIYIKVNVKSRSDIKTALKKAEEEFGGIDILVNNAGINNPNDFDKITDEEWDNILAVNLRGPFIVSQEALEYLRKSNSGRIINIGSVSGQYGGPRTAHYAASKAGLISLSQVIARFTAKDNIRCNTIAVGMVESEMAATGMKSEVVQQAVKNILLNRMGTYEEVAKVVAFLASDESNYITAQTINVNGGLYF